MEENDIDGVVDVVDAREVEAQVAREQGQVIGGEVTGSGQAPHRRDVLAEINAVTSLLRAQQRAPSSNTQETVDGDVTQALMQQRLEGLQAALAACPASSDQDAWSSSEESAGPDEAAAVAIDAPAPARALVETERERNIRMGLITPFDNVAGASRRVRRDALPPGLTPAPLLAPSSHGAKLSAMAKRLTQRRREQERAREAVIEMAPEDLDEDMLQFVQKQEYFKLRKSNVEARQAVAAEKAAKFKRKQTLTPTAGGGRSTRQKVELTEAVSGKRRRQKLQISPEDSGSSERSPASGDGTASRSKRENSCRGRGGGLEDSDSSASRLSDVSLASSDERVDATGFDDADSDWYVGRVLQWERRECKLLTHAPGSSAVRKAVLADDGADDTEATIAAKAGVSSGRPQNCDHNVETVRFDGGFAMPARTYDQLFPYQQVGVKWLWELHVQRTGGIMGDEMGLGKTVQLVAFLGGLAHSKLYKPSIVVAPVTTIRHWQRELRMWCPLFRVIVLHHTARSAGGVRAKPEDLIRLATKGPLCILLTSYEQLRKHALALLEVGWGYAVLDEGHRIRNPDAEITLLCKQVPRVAGPDEERVVRCAPTTTPGQREVKVKKWHMQMRTVHRIIMTGTPIQNRLTELWSLFDYVFPGRLGTLPVFQSHFGTPIQAGTFSNASSVAVAAAYRCAVMLRDLISPYLLRRTKADIAKQLPEKTEQVLFCTLSPPQRKLYKAYLASKDVSEILEGKRAPMEGITILRKICNHADLLHRLELINNPEVEYGALERSTKLQVAMKVLAKWHQQGHKALFFTQTQQMLDIMERHVNDAELKYHRMDGSVPLQTRFRMIDDFNNNPDIFLFLLTTRVGGLGVNLTGADRILLFDPDWNPATDIQARERAWRLGQKRPVTIFRFITRGTIEEQVYHRQVYKHTLSTRILQDPRQKRFVSSRSLRQLFTLTDMQHAGTSETGAIFRGVSEQVTAADLAAAPVVAHDAPELRGSEVDGAVAAPSRATPQTQLENGRTRSRCRAKAGCVRKNGEAAVAAENHKGFDDDSTILRELFSGQGLHSALNHSAIEDASDPAKLDVERQAAKVAQRAAAALRASREAVRKEPVHMPTWTGRAGTSGACTQQFGNVRWTNTLQPSTQQPARAFASGASAGVTGVAVSSAAVIAQHHSREVEAALEANRPNKPSAREAAADELMARLVAFLTAQEGHRASSAQVLDEFAGDLERDRGLLLKQSLKQVAVLHKQPGGGVWTLKSAFL